MRKKIDLNHQYSFPSDVRFIQHRGKILVILPETSNWIVLENNIQFEFFNKLLTNTISESLSFFPNNYQDCVWVVTQIEARHLESSSVTKNKEYNMHLYLTNECNLMCPHCYMFAGKKDKDELSSTEVFEILKNFKSIGGLGVVLSGGEIALRKDLVDIIKFANSLELKVDILSNGTLLTPGIIKQISPYIERAQISIDGYSEESNSKVRGFGNFDKSLQAVDLLFKNGVKTEIAITPFPNPNLEKEVDDYVSFCKSINLKYDGKVKTKITTDIFEGRTINPSIEEKEKYSEITEQIEITLLGGKSRNDGFVYAARMQAINDNCSFGNINITSNGDVYPCAKVGQTTKFGNIRTDSFAEIVQKSKRLQEYSDVNNLIPCKDCELKYICGGGCRIDYFEGFHQIDFENNDLHPKRNCSKEYKSQMLDLLLETNEKIFT